MISIYGKVSEMKRQSRMRPWKNPNVFPVHSNAVFSVDIKRADRKK